MTTVTLRSAAPTTSAPMPYAKRLKLFTGRANPQIAKAIARQLNIDLTPVTLKTFSNGEVYCRLEESVREADVFIVQPTCPNSEVGLSTNDALMELMVMIDAAVAASAHRVIAVMPWYAYSRQDKQSAPREPISARMIARMLESAGANRVMTMDLHAGQIQGMFKIPVDHITAMRLLADRVAEFHSGEPLVVVAPDAGRVKLNKSFAKCLHADLAILDKERPRHQVAEVGHVIGDVRDKSAVIVDDIIDTAGTLCAAAEAVMKAGAARVYATATHPLLTGRAYDNLRAAPFEDIVVTDTVTLRPDALANLHVVSCAEMLADSIRQVFSGGSISESFGAESYQS
jgi:ribose-phosphate pyrophosphokinase